MAVIPDPAEGKVNGGGGEVGEFLVAIASQRPMNMQCSLAQRMFLVLGVLLLFGCAQHPTQVESDASLPERETLIDIVRCVAADTALLVQAGLVIEELNQLKVLHARNEGPQPLSITEPVEKIRTHAA
ncbi:MAG: hypothetical protein IPP83_08700 [Flavobacteriales bacterium]|nr:hypothetical protein [Flavobacteriales bacterium]